MKNNSNDAFEVLSSYGCFTLRGTVRVRKAETLFKLPNPINKEFKTAYFIFLLLIIIGSYQCLKYFSFAKYLREIWFYCTFNLHIYHLTKEYIIIIIESTFRVTVINMLHHVTYNNMNLDKIHLL